MGNHTVSCKKRIQGNGRGDKYEIFSYLFQKEQCIDCPHRDICIGKSKKKARTLRVAANAPIYYEISQEQKKPEFQEKYKKRSAQEWKNGDMKRFHGMSRARGWGLRSILLQAKYSDCGKSKKNCGDNGRESHARYRFYQNSSANWVPFWTRFQNLFPILLPDKHIRLNLIVFPFQNYSFSVVSNRPLCFSEKGFVILLTKAFTK